MDSGSLCAATWQARLLLSTLTDLRARRVKSWLRTKTLLFDPAAVDAAAAKRKQPRSFARREGRPSLYGGANNLLSESTCSTVPD